MYIGILGKLAVDLLQFLPFTAYFDSCGDTVGLINHTNQGKPILNDKFLYLFDRY